MSKLRIEYSRKGCIGAFACVSIDAERWSIGEDSKADLLKGEKTEKDGKEIWVLELEVSEEEREKIIQGGEVCPVNVIQVFDESGKKLI